MSDLRKRMAVRLVTALAGGMLLSGCASLQNAGSASYSIKPFVTISGALICCEVVIADGKERASLEVSVVKQGENYSITLKEQGVQAFPGQAIAAGAAQSATAAAAKVAVGAALAPLMPALLPGVGAAAGVMAQ